MLNWIEDSNEVLKAMTNMEGSEWAEQQLTHTGRLSFSYAIKWCSELLKEDPERAQENDFGFSEHHVIYGWGGWSRYWLFPNGDVAFSKGHCPLEDKVEKARSLGFRVV